MFLATLVFSAPASAQQPPPDASAQPAADARHPVTVAPGAGVLVESQSSARPAGGLAAYMQHLRPGEPGLALRRDGPRYSSTHSQYRQRVRAVCRPAPIIIASCLIVPDLHLINNYYEDYLGTGEPLKTDDDLKGLHSAGPVSREGVTGSLAPRGLPPTTRCWARHRKTISRSRPSASCGSASAAVGAVADARSTRQRRHAHGGLAPEH